MTDDAPIIISEDQTLLARLEANRQVRTKFALIWLIAVFAILLINLPIASYFERMQTAQVMQTPIWQDAVYGIVVITLLIGSFLLNAHIIEKQIEKFGLAVLCPFCSQALDDEESARYVRTKAQCRHCKQQIVEAQIVEAPCKESQPFKQSHETNVLRVQITKATVIAWLSILFFGFCTVMSWRDVGSLLLSAAFLPFIALSVFLLLIYGPVEMSSERIVHCTLLARYQMRWSEVERIEVGEGSSGIVFYGNQKRLSIIGAGYWSGANRVAMLHLFHKQVEEREIPLEQTWKADYTLSKNSKVSLSNTWPD